MVVQGVGKTVQDASGTLDILREIDVSLQPRETVAIVGASGSGKSTVLRALCGLPPLARGRVALTGVAEGGTELLAPATQAFRRQVQMVFQDPYGSLHPRQTGRTSAPRPSWASWSLASPASLVASWFLRHPVAWQL